MIDNAQRLLGLLAGSATNRASLATQLRGEYDANKDGSVDAGEFQRIFAEMLVDPAAAPAVAGRSSYPVHKTLFASTLYPSFSRNFAISAYQASEAVSGLDLNKDGKVSSAELDGTSTDHGVVLTSAQRADDLLALYDTAGKGTIELADITAAWTKDPTLGDPAHAQAAVTAWDQNGNGQITRNELIATYDAMDGADALLAVFDPGKTGVINIAAAAHIASTDFPDAAAKFASWDADGNGSLTRKELVSGLLTTSTPTPTPAPTDPALLAATLLAQYDSDGDGGISVDEFTAHAQDPDAEVSFAAWDTNQDSVLTLDELQTGIAQVQQAQAIVSQYDTAGKGYFDLADLRAAIDPATVADVAASAAEIMSFWDADGDGQVTTSEVISGIQVGGYVGGEQMNTGADATTPATPA